MFELNDDNDIYSTNTPVRIRMATLYGVAGLVGGRVCNTGNRSEAYVGYTTKYGDLAGDFALLKNFTVREVLEIGDALELAYNLVHNVPSDGMSGKSDEDKIGFSYETLDNYLLEGTYPDYDTYCKIEQMHKRGMHKQACICLPAPQNIAREKYIPK